MFGISLKPEMLLGIIKAIPPEKIQQARQELVSSIAQAEINAGSELMIVLTADIKSQSLVLSLYRRSGEYLTHANVYDIQSVFAAIEQIKNFDFKKNTQNAIAETTATAYPGNYSSESAAAGIPATGATEPTGTDRSRSPAE